MIRELEVRLAAVLGATLAPPFAGRVDPAPASGPPGDQPRIVVGVHRVARLSPDFGSPRHDVVPGAQAPRRVARLACELSLRVQPADTAGREQQLAGVDALVYALDDPALLAALPTPGDPGFLLDALELVDATVPLDPAETGAVPVAVSVRALGVFWPVGAAGQDGPVVRTVRVRGASLPVTVAPPPDPLAPGGPPAVIGLRLEATGTLVVDADEAAAAPFGRVAARLLTPDGKPGKGTLSGGVDGPAPGVRLFELTAGTAELTYTPPAEAATDLLVVTLDTGEGVEVSRTELTTRGP